MVINDCKIGTELFRYVDGAGVFRYVVDGIRTYNNEIQLEVECKTCSHGYQCRLLLAQDDRGRIFHVHLLNDSEEESQAYWHTNDGFFFVVTSQEAKQQKVAKMIKSAEDGGRKAQENLEGAKARLKEYQGLIEEVQE